MTEISLQKSCKPCIRRRNYSWMPALLVAILPKCPFCVMAYSGAVSMCSGNMLYPNAGSFSSYITIGLAILVLVSILINYKGKRSIVAAFICLAGMGFLAISQFYSIGEVNYYIGVALIFFGIWYNASFFYFYRKYNSIKMNFISKLHS